jgi:hypothetical protein
MKNPAVPLIVFVVFSGAFTLSLPDSSLRDGLLVMQVAALFAAGYAYWKGIKK